MAARTAVVALTRVVGAAPEPADLDAAARALRSVSGGLGVLAGRDDLADVPDLDGEVRRALERPAGRGGPQPRARPWSTPASPGSSCPPARGACSRCSTRRPPPSTGWRGATGPSAGRPGRRPRWPPRRAPLARGLRRHRGARPRARPLAALAGLANETRRARPRLAVLRHRAPARAGAARARPRGGPVRTGRRRRGAGRCGARSRSPPTRAWSPTGGATAPTSRSTPWGTCCWPTGTTPARCGSSSTAWPSTCTTCPTGSARRAQLAAVRSAPASPRGPSAARVRRRPRRARARGRPRAGRPPAGPRGGRPGAARMVHRAAPAGTVTAPEPATGPPARTMDTDTRPSPARATRHYRVTHRTDLRATTRRWPRATRSPG